MTLDVPIRVRYAEIDAMGVAYHGHYFTWFEVARVELMRTLGLRYRDLESEGIYLPVIDCRARYIAAARYDASLQVRTALMAASRAKVVFGYEVRDPDFSPTLLACGQTTHAFTTDKGKATRLPPAHPLWQGMCQVACLPKFVSFD
jgi:acyl-CoA thioester hydrolase